MTAQASTTPARRRWAWPAAIALAAVVAAATWWWFRPPPIPDIDLGNAEPELAEAVGEARAALAREPRSGEAWGTLGRTLLANELYPEISLVCFTHAERFEPDNPRWPYFKAGVQLNLGRRADALVSLERALRMNVAAADAETALRMLLAETHLALTNTMIAEGLFREQLDREPNHARARFGLATVLMSRGEWQSCREHFEACLRSPHARKKACIHLATVCAQLGDRKHTAYFSDLAARLPKDLAWSDPYYHEHVYLLKRMRDRYELADRFEAEGRFGLALKIVDGILAEHPNDDGALLTKGRLLTRMGQLQAAETHLRRALELAPDKVQAHYFLSLALLLRGESVLAKGAVPVPPPHQERPAEKPAEKPAATLTGSAAQAAPLFEQSAAAARRAIAAAPDFGRAYMALGRALYYLGRKADALAALRQAVHCNPEFVDNHFFLGEMLAEDGQLAEARHYLEQAQQLADPADPRPSNALKKYFPQVK
ncbi:MAG: tetratricopeptide repeat protein [Gemmataceae bacterium]|nr:tetratricopeptide repeat protein [Gemmataceae bacterium]